MVTMGERWGVGIPGVGGKSRGQSFPPFPASLKCLHTWVNQLTLVSIMKSSKSLPIPWRWLSTEHVTAPPSCLHTIISRGMRPPIRALAPDPPSSKRVCQTWWLANSSESSLLSHCLEVLWSPLLRAGFPIVLYSDRRWGEWPPASWSMWVRLLCEKQTNNCVCSWTILFAFRGCMLSLIGKMASSRGRSHILGVHNDKQAENRQGGGILGVFLKPVIPEGATPALVRMSLLINSLMIKNLCIHISGQRRTPFLERRQTTLAYHQHMFCHRWVPSQPWFSSLHTSPL